MKLKIFSLCVLGIIVQSTQISYGMFNPFIKEAYQRVTTDLTLREQNNKLADQGYRLKKNSPEVMNYLESVKQEFADLDQKLHQEYIPQIQQLEAQVGYQVFNANKGTVYTDRVQFQSDILPYIVAADQARDRAEQLLYRPMQNIQNEPCVQNLTIPAQVHNHHEVKLSIARTIAYQAAVSLFMLKSITDNSININNLGQEITMLQNQVFSAHVKK